MSKLETFHSGMQEAGNVDRMLIIGCLCVLGYSIASLAIEVGASGLKIPLWLLGWALLALAVKPFVAGAIAVYRGENA